MEASHLCFHTLEAALAGYAAERVSAHTAAERSVIGGQRSMLAFSRKTLKRQDTNTSNSGAVLIEGGPESGASTTACPSLVAGPEVAVTKFILLAGNHGKDKTLLPRPPTDMQAAEDSDQEPGFQTSSGDMTKAVVCKRNARFFQKHACKVQFVTENVGYGLYATEDVTPGTQFPVKGPWFTSLKEVQAYLGTLDHDTATMLARRVIRVNVQCPEAAPDKEKASDGDGNAPASEEHLYKVPTGPPGYINHFTALSNQPNCQLVLLPDVAQGEHNLVVKCTKAIKAGKEWLLNYGPLHVVGSRAQPKKRAAGSSATGSRPRRARK
jgi:hypothetical protein